MNYKKAEPEIFKFMIKSEYYLYRVGKRMKQNLKGTLSFRVLYFHVHRP